MSVMTPDGRQICFAYNNASDGRQICFAYNNASESCGGGCGRIHVCRRCYGLHPVHQCPAGGAQPAL